MGSVLYVMIILVADTGGPYDRVQLSIDHVEFSSEARCEEAKPAVLALVPDPPAQSISVACVRK